MKVRWRSEVFLTISTSPGPVSAGRYFVSIGIRGRFASRCIFGTYQTAAATISAKTSQVRGLVVFLAGSTGAIVIVGIAAARADDTGAPQLGQAPAMSEICLAHSEHDINAIVESSLDTCKHTAPDRLPNLCKKGARLPLTV